ncbi:MAG TPA: YceI family protein [Caldilineaceae bacterium]|nr:YceI family protein [Caldilineaceae bacterium]
MSDLSTKRISYLWTLLLLFTLVAAACGGGNQTGARAMQEQPGAASPDAPTAVAPVRETPLPLSETGVLSDVVPATKRPAAASTFVIDQSQSQARFILSEKLVGRPKSVIGVTQLVDGSITLDPADLTKTKLSPIQIDARDFTTDSGMRNTAIRRFILQSSQDQYRYIVFTPTALKGLPASGQATDTLTFEIAGDLTISGVTKPVTFVTTVTADSATKLSGLAKAHVLRSDFNLNIPSVSGVADVTNEVQLELQFVATAQ